ncbi:MAG: hypothetical protein LBP75_06795 [Planctomycetota bacterium]|jgi:hypothetical protein|nr:hypothetical protein [Planctomycetota bacterium]
MPTPRAAAETAITSLSNHFVFRKLGLCYDYYAEVTALLSPPLPELKDVKAGLPNPRGVGSGLADCALNGALLFDGLATRVELGIAAADEGLIYDRLIGGLIRLATIAPRHTVIAGLTPDGKGYYPPVGYEATLYWAYQAWRAGTTPTGALDSQTKIRSIGGHWVGDLWTGKLQTLETDETALVRGIIKPALLAVGYRLTGEDKWKDLAINALDVAAPLAAATPLRELFNAQLALRLLADIFYPFKPRRYPSPNQKKKADAEPEVKEPPVIDTRFVVAHEKILAKMKEIAPLFLPSLRAGKNFAPRFLDERPTLDWREVKNDIPWGRIAHEADTLAAPLFACLGLFWANDKQFTDAAAAALTEMLAALPVEKLWLARALTPLPLLHGLGVENGCWDADLNDYQLAWNKDDSLVEKFLAPNYDHANPLQAGHNEKRARTRVVAPVAPAPVATPAAETKYAGKNANHRHHRHRRRR